ncbi:hypothetical protein V6N11_054272 [Hibiscus sabdariffa]|uniref:Rx N-terminal domain-containing protein n=1 Tax=Hibiscus sabdariffa TaxID=183260 RepID=A0ABR2S481_9ROSI
MPLLEALSAIREVVVSKVIDFFLDKLASSDLLQFATEKEVQQEIQKLNKELKEIRAVLDDAEERQMKEQVVKDWLINLQDLAYDVEDVLDEFATEMGSRNLMVERRGSSSKRPRLIPDSYKAAMFNRDMMSKIKYIIAKLKDLQPQKNKLQLRMMDSERPDRPEDRVQPTSVEIETQVYGRDEDKRKILDLLLKSDEEGNFVIPIVEKGYQIRELQDLSCLKGQLHISGLQNIVEPRDAWMAKLHDKPRIDKLELSWSEGFENRIPALEKKVLDGLQPSKKLKELAISFYCGAKLADWVGDSFFNDLQSLCLDDCPNLLSLPSIGKLPLLKKVRLKGLGSITRVGVELLGDIAPCAFPSLETLQFEDMPKWEKWSLPEVEEEAKTFPRLRELLIQKCPLLWGSIPEHLPSLEKLMIQDCEKLRVPIESFPVLSEIKIQRCHEVVYKGFTEDSSLKRVSFSDISKFSCAPECLRLRNITVESLEINNCEDLRSFHESSWEWLTQPMSLRILKIIKCARLVSIGAEDEREETMQVKIPNNIEQMTIRNCQRLEKLSLTLHCLRSVWMIELYSCPKLVSLARNNLPLNLKVLKVYNCGNLQSLLLDEEDVNSKNACVLRQLYIHGCDSLKQINRGELPSTLKELGICRCSKLESIAQDIQDNSSLQSINIFWCDMIKDLPHRFNKLKHLQCIYIEHCTNLVSFPESGLPATSLKVFRLASCEQLQALPENMHCLSSLEELEILDCPNVTSFPEEGIPTDLRSLGIRGPNICKPIQEWGLHRLTSLRSLWISNGCPEAVSFPQDEMGTTLPSCLTHLEVWNFPKLEILSSNGFRNLTSLESLVIIDCPNLKFLPEKDMLSSLLRLYISSGVLEERCKGDNIAYIPFVSISN